MKQNAASAVLNRIPASANAIRWTVMNMRRSAKIISQKEKIINKYFALVLSIVNAACIVVNIINQKWDVMTLNIITCVICIANFIVND
jgi:hypothetical protein